MMMMNGGKVLYLLGGDKRRHAGKAGASGESVLLVLHERLYSLMQHHHWRRGSINHQPPSNTPRNYKEADLQEQPRVESPALARRVVWQLCADRRLKRRRMKG